MNGMKLKKHDHDHLRSKAQCQIKRQPFVSICTLTHNRPDYLRRLLTCIESQTYPLNKIEWLILDDSTEYLQNIEIKSQSLINIKYRRLREKMTLGAKRNLSHKLCNGQFIVYMDDDDFYFPKRVAHAVDALRKSNKEIAGSTYIPANFSHDDQIWLSGPFGKNHGTAHEHICNDKEFLASISMTKTLHVTKKSLSSIIIQFPWSSLIHCKILSASPTTRTPSTSARCLNGPTHRMRPLRKSSQFAKATTQGCWLPRSPFPAARPITLRNVTHCSSVHGGGPHCDRSK